MTDFDEIADLKEQLQAANRAIEELSKLASANNPPEDLEMKYLRLRQAFGDVLAVINGDGGHLMSAINNDLLASKAAIAKIHQLQRSAGKLASSLEEQLENFSDILQNQCQDKRCGEWLFCRRCQAARDIRDLAGWLRSHDE